MKLQHLALAAALAAVGASASAQTSTFINNGGVHESFEYGSDTFTSSVLDKFSFTLASLMNLDASIATLSATPLTGTVTLWKDETVDTSVGSFSLATGSASFASLGAGDYYYLVSASGATGGGFVLGSFAAAVPEPESLALMLAGLGAVGFMVRRRTEG